MSYGLQLRLDEQSPKSADSLTGPSKPGRPGSSDEEHTRVGAVSFALRMLQHAEPSILSFETLDGVAWYMIQLSEKHDRKLYKKQYKDFKELHKALQDLKLQSTTLDVMSGEDNKLDIPELPSCGNFGVRQKFDLMNFSQKLQVGLQEWLEKLFAEEWSPDEGDVIQAFFSFDKAYKSERTAPLRDDGPTLIGAWLAGAAEETEKQTPTSSAKTLDSLQREDVLEVSILSSETRDGVTLYTIQVSEEHEQRLYKKQYKEFKWLQLGLHEIKKEDGSKLVIPKLPDIGRFGVRQKLGLGDSPRTANAKFQNSLQQFLEKLFAQEWTLER